MVWPRLTHTFRERSKYAWSTPDQFSEVLCQETSSYSTRKSPHTMHVRSLPRKRLNRLSSDLTELQIHATNRYSSEGSVSQEDELDEAMTVWHYHFDAWPDHGVPAGKSVEALRALVMEIGRHRDELGGVNTSEVWVHWYLIIFLHDLKG